MAIYFYNGFKSFEVEDYPKNGEILKYLPPVFITTEGSVVWLGVHNIVKRKIHYLNSDTAIRFYNYYKNKIEELINNSNKTQSFEEASLKIGEIIKDVFKIEFTKTEKE